MSESIEIEFKTLITAKEFAHVQSFFQIEESGFHYQLNSYFDTEDSLLKQKKWGLRIRQLSDRGELTLKIPRTEGLLEVTDDLTVKEAEHYLQKQQLPDSGNVAKALTAQGILPQSLKMIASLKTRRAEIKIQEGLLALDESWYGKQHDFELELEVADAEKGRQDFFDLLEKLQLSYVPAPNKIVRAISEN